MFIRYDMTQNKILTLFEYILIFLAMPAVVYFHATRWNVHVALWLVGVYALIWLNHVGKIDWRKLWHGHGWPISDRKMAALRFCASTPAIIILTYFLAPQRMFSFPMQHPVFWLVVMLLYPILSVIPQEFVFRSYFFRRYRTIFPDERILKVMSAFSFAFVHIVFHNPVSPTLCLIAGGIFAHSYSQHRSLKWAVVEHAAYGCMVFTVGIGYYFLVGGGTLH